MENGTSVPAVPCGGSETGNVIGSVGRFVPQKNFPLLVEAISRLRHLGHYPTLCLVGDGPEMPTIRAAIRRLGMTESVLLPGMQMDVQSWLCRFDIFANSSDEEGHPIALLEAMAGGLPCVATDVGGVSQTLDSGLEGLLIPPRDADAMASAIASLLENVQLRRSLGLAARERVRRQFSIDAAAHRHVSLYDHLLAGRRVEAVGAQR
jgi:glycosyltransferase involved in cell wall biosynthesis